MKENVLITGGSGLVGTALADLLISEGYNVAILSRNKNIKSTNSFYWDYEKDILDNEAIEFADIIIHLAGEGIANKRWTKVQKRKIIESRVKTTNLILEKVKSSNKKPHTIISASAVGYYGSDLTDKVFSEKDDAGSDFVADVVKKWEASVDGFSKIGLRVVKLRIGIVLSSKGGALPKMVLPIKYGIGSAIGSGKQYMPWIALEDLTRMFLFIIENKNTKSVYNAVGVEHIDNYNFMKQTAEIMGKPFFMPRVPAFMLKMALGELSQIVLTGSKVSSTKIKDAGFVFKINSLKEFLKLGS